MKNLHKKIGVAVLSGALLMGGVLASGKSFVYANNGFDDYLSIESKKHDFDIIDSYYNGSNENFKNAAAVLEYYGMSYVGKIPRISYEDFINKKKQNQLKRGIYIVRFDSFRALIGVGGIDIEK